MPAGPEFDGGPRSAENMIELDFSPDTLMEEIDGDGWLSVTRPVGADAGALIKLPTIGGRGLEDRSVSSDSRAEPR
ncbi:MAG TPA: hypothetical protein VGO87_11415 [Acidimicrobiia bacterium]|jgi:hypothetical protein